DVLVGHRDDRLGLVERILTDARPGDDDGLRLFLRGHVCGQHCSNQRCGEAITRGWGDPPSVFEAHRCPPWSIAWVVQKPRPARIIYSFWDIGEKFCCPGAQRGRSVWSPEWCRRCTRHASDTTDRPARG